MKKWRFAIILMAGIIGIQASFTENSITDKVMLGEKLFFDPILSSDRSISCASCHRPEFGFADTTAVSTGVAGRKGKRNTPPAMNIRLNSSFFWDGRSATMEEQALAPIENPDEMNLPLPIAILRLKKDSIYRQAFRRIFNSEPTAKALGAAIAAYEQTLETSESPFDDWKFSGDSSIVGPAVMRGFDIFNGKGKCVQCHFGSDFTQHDFRNIGLFNGKEQNDSGRILISKKKEDLGKFKTAGLRNIAITAPYMHNGMLTSLDAVIDFYDDPKNRPANPINTDSLLIQPLGLTSTEKADLKSFLLALTDKRYTKTKR